MFWGCTSLVNAPVISAQSVGTTGCRQMFRNCTSLVTAPELPATTLAPFAYANMFYGCTSLVNVQQSLPAINLSGYNNVYGGMFNGCTSLVNAPALPATVLSNNCYQSMFNGCTSLVNAPALPATTLANSCYQSMFQNCTSLVNAPALPATTLTASCYFGMFDYCTSLVNAPVIEATTLASYCCQIMFRSCLNLINAPELKSTTLVTSCYYQMFQSCIKLNNIKVGFSSWLKDATYNWLGGTSSTGTFIAPSGLTDTRGTSNIPTNWTLSYLPYKQGLLYLQSTGTQYINTDVFPDYAIGDEIEISFYGANYSEGAKGIFGSRDTGGTNGIYAVGSNVIVADNNSTQVIPFDYRNNHVLKINNNEIINNGNVLAPVTKRVTTTRRVYIFAMNIADTIYGIYGGMKLYYWKYYHNGALAQHLIPVLDNDNTPCMYDNVNNTLVYNAGTGDFNYA